MKWGKVLAVILCLFVPEICFASHAGSFLRIGVGARALGMGGAFVAIVDDPTAIYWNPAGLILTETSELSSMYTNQFGLDAHYFFLAFAEPWGEKRAWATGIINLSIGDIPLTGLDEHGRPVVIGYTSSNETALILGYAQILFRTPLGITLKGIRQTLVDASSLGLGFDFGIRSSLPFNISFGMVIRTGFVNWSTGERTIFPIQLIMGMAFRPFSSLVLAFDVGLQSDGWPEVHAGGEYFLVPQVPLRIGLDRGNLTAGVGFLMGQFKLDYALMFHDLGLSHRLSFGMKF